MTMQGGRRATYKGGARGRAGRGIGLSRKAAQTARDQPRLSRKRQREDEGEPETESEETEEEESLHTASEDSEEESALRLTLKRRNPPADISDSDPDFTRD